MRSDVARCSKSAIRGARTYSYVRFDANPIWASILLAVHIGVFIVVSALAILHWQAHIDFRHWAARRRPPIDTAIKGPAVADEDVQRDR